MGGISVGFLPFHNMFTTSTISIFLFAVALTQGLMDEDPECRPPPPPIKVSECCAAPRLLGGDDDTTADIMKKCHEEAGMKPLGPPGSGTPPTAEEIAAHQTAHECGDECLFKNFKFLTSAGELDKDAIKSTLTKICTGDWAEIGSTSFDKCFATAKSSVGASAKCKSGAKQFVMCISRELFLSCPASSWTESTECAASKALITKCPNAVVALWGPKPKHA